MLRPIPTLLWQLCSAVLGVLCENILHVHMHSSIRPPRSGCGEIAAFHVDSLGEGILVLLNMIRYLFDPYGSIALRKVAMLVKRIGV